MVKFILLLICFFLLICGILFRIDFVVISASIFYFLSLFVGIIELVVILKRAKKDRPVLNNNNTIINKLARIIEGVILLSGLLMLLAAKNNKGFAIAGSVIWFGSILLYFLSGIIMESITKIPLEFGYGGWKMKRFKKRRRK